MPTASAWHWVWLVAAMFMAQTLGLAHNVLHTTTPQGVHAWAALHTRTHEGAHGNWLARLFPDHDHASDCHLYDQASHGDCVPTAVLLHLPAAHPPALPQLFQAFAPAKPTIRVQARGPPPSTDRQPLVLQPLA